MGGLGYWRFVASKSNLTTPATVTIQQEQPLEVPKTLPQATLDERVKSLEDLSGKLVTQVNGFKSSSTQAPSGLDSRLSAVESAVTELKARVSALEKATPATAVSSASSTMYIPLGSGGSWTDIDWRTLSEYEVSLDPANFQSYTGMTLEVTFRLDDPSGTASVRLYNVSDSSATSSQIDSTSSSFASKSSSSFKLATGTKTYRLQVKSTGGKNLIIQTARIKVSF